jgi:hypothetical protein
MRTAARTFVALIHLGTAGMMGSTSAHAQTVLGTIALKSGESTELGDLYWVTNCRSLLKSTPEVDILDGPPGVSVAVKAAMVTPRAQRCANQVPGGKLVITAGVIEDPSFTQLTIRVTYRTRDGDRKFSRVYDLSLFP